MTHTILGASGQIGTELARALHAMDIRGIRLVGRRPRRIHADDELVAADLLDADATRRAVAGSDVAYLTVGLPADSRLWAAQLPVMMANVIDACAAERVRLVFFDNTYMYPKTSEPQTEETAFAPVGSKASTRAAIATTLLEAMASSRVEAVICRAPEFYGPGRTQGFTNALVFDRIRAGERPRVPVRDDVLRTLIWTPDASRATARIGTTPEAFGQTWHLPVDPRPRTYRELLAIAAHEWSRALPYDVVPAWQLRLAGVVSKQARELGELLPRYAVDTVFSSAKFDAAFPDFSVTTYEQGIAALRREEADA